MNNRVVIIGNNANGNPVHDGGRIKIRLYQRLLEKCGVDCRIIDLCGWAKRFFKILFLIRKSVLDKNTILIMGGPKGSRFLIPLINFFNARIKTRVVFCPLGIGVLDAVVKRLTLKELESFMKCEENFNLKDKRMSKHLRRLDLIIPQNEIISKVYKWFYSLNNVCLLNNFRDVDISIRKYVKQDPMRVIYISRICDNKGVFDLLEAIRCLNKETTLVKLDLYGEIQLTEKEQRYFNSFLNDSVRYLGCLEPQEVADVIKKYNLFVLPTKYYGEGTSGSLIESFLSGTPALISSFNQASLLVNDGVSGYIFELGNVKDLTAKLYYIYSNQSELKRIGLEAQKQAIKYTFEFNKHMFLDYILGGNNNENFDC